MSEVKSKTIGDQSLDYIHIHNADDLPAIVILHGYGANMRDLSPIASLSPEFKRYNWYFIDGPLQVPIGPYMYGKAWFPIDMEELNRAMMNNSFETLFADKLPEGLNDSAGLVSSFCKDLPESKLILGGFSQGSMMAQYICFSKLIKPPSALILLSSTLVARNTLTKQLDEYDERLPIFQSHGQNDPVLPIQMAQALNSELQKFGQKVQYFEFNGAHEIPPKILGELDKFLQENI